MDGFCPPVYWFILFDQLKAFVFVVGEDVHFDVLTLLCFFIAFSTCSAVYFAGRQSQYPSTLCALRLPSRTFASLSSFFARSNSCRLVADQVIPSCIKN